MKKVGLLLSFIFFCCFQADAKPFFVNVTALEYGGHNRNFDVECDEVGRVYIANFEGLLLWNGVEWDMLHTPGVSRITSLYKSPLGTIWVGGYNVFGRIKNGNEIEYFVSDTSSVSSFGEVSTIFSSGENIYFIAEGKSYTVSDGAILEAQNVDPPVKSSVLELGNLGCKVLSTATKGVVILDSNGRTIDSVDSSDGLCSDNVSSLAYDGKGSVWGTTDNGIFRMVLSPVYSRFGQTDGLLGQVTAITHHNGVLYVGTLQGLFVLRDGRFERVDGFNLACWQMKTIRGSLYVAGAKGLYVIGEEGLEQVNSRHTLSICEYDKESFLTGEVDGIYRHFFSSGNEEKISDARNVARFSVEEGGTVWAVNYYSENYSLAPGQSRFEKKENHLSLLFEYRDNEGRVWRPQSGNSGLSCDDIPLEERKWLQPLEIYDIQTMEVYGKEAWVGGNFGLLKLDISQIQSSRPFQPILHLRSFSSKDSRVSYTSSLDKSDPFGKVLYSYKLHSLDKWSEWSENKGMVFDHLQPGKYSLQLRSRDSFGTVCEIDPITFKVEQPFYFKWYAILVYLIVAFVIVWGILRYRLYKAKKEKERLEGLVKQRTSELEEAQGKLLRQEREATVGKLTKGLIDRILNPMNYINNFSHLSNDLASDLRENLEDDKDNMTADIYDDCMDIADMLKTNLGKIEEHGLATTRILKAMEELLKERNKKLDPVDVVETCRKGVEVFKEYHKNDLTENGISVEFSANVDSVIVDVNEEALVRALMSMLNNAIYAVERKVRKGYASGEDKPGAGISLQVSDDKVSIGVYDNGIGIEDTIMDKIFDPFFTTKPTSEAPGVGLYLSQQVISDMGGRIEVESKKDEYTLFTVEFPKKKI